MADLQVRRYLKHRGNFLSSEDVIVQIHDTAFESEQVVDEVVVVLIHSFVISLLGNIQLSAFESHQSH